MVNECRPDEFVSKKGDLQDTDDYEEHDNFKREASKKNANGQPSYNRIYSSTSTGNYQKNVTGRTSSENFHHKNYQESLLLAQSKQQQQQQQQQQQENFQQRRRESSGGRECNYQMMTKTKKLSKFSSMNENHRRSSLSAESEFDFPPLSCGNETKEAAAAAAYNRIPVKTVYAKHTSSMKEPRSAALRRMSALEEEKTKLKMFNSRDLHQTKSVIMNDTAASSVQFHRPLKTSTALCLADLTRRQSLKEESSRFKQEQQHTLFSESQYVNGQFKLENMERLEPTLVQKHSDSSSSYASNISSSESASVSSSLDNNPQKRFKTSTGSKASKIEKIKESRMKKAASRCQDDSPLHKRRHSATAAILTNFASTIQTTTTTIMSGKTLTKLRVGNDLPQWHAIEESLFYHVNKEMPANDLMANDFFKESNSDDLEDSSASSDSSCSSEEDEEANEANEENGEGTESSSNELTNEQAEYLSSSDSTQSSIDQNEASDKIKGVYQSNIQTNLGWTSELGCSNLGLIWGQCFLQKL